MRIHNKLYWGNTGRNGISPIFSHPPRPRWIHYNQVQKQNVFNNPYVDFIVPHPPVYRFSGPLQEGPHVYNGPNLKGPHVFDGPHLEGPPVFSGPPLEGNHVFSGPSLDGSRQFSGPPQVSYYNTQLIYSNLSLDSQIIPDSRQPAVQSYAQGTRSSYHEGSLYSNLLSDQDGTNDQDSSRINVNVPEFFPKVENTFNCPTPDFLPQEKPG